MITNQKFCRTGTMKKLQKHGVIVSVLAALLMSSSAWAVQTVTPLENDNTQTSTQTSAGYTVGMQFTVGTKPVAVTALGVWVQSSTTPLGESHQVGIWNSSGTLMGSVTVPSGTAGTLVGDFRYANLASSITLAAGQVYYLGAYYPTTTDPYRGGSIFTLNSGLTGAITSAEAYYGAGFAKPSSLGYHANTYDGYLGPNMEVALLSPPSILFCAPATLGNGFVDLGYLSLLSSKGYNVDYTNTLADLAPVPPATQPKININNYNVVVIYAAPIGQYATSNLSDTNFNNNVIIPYVNAGGGLLIIDPEQFQGSPLLDQSLLSSWGLEIMSEKMTESSSPNISSDPTYMPGYNSAYTSNVNAASPVTSGVTGIWYPYWNWYYQVTHPLGLDSTWTTAVSATTTTTTSRVTYGNPQPNPTPYTYPSDPISNPPFFATRDSVSGTLGRVAAISTFPQYSVGSGTTWLFNSDVLSNGYTISGTQTASNFGQLLMNTFTWLGQPSQLSQAVGYPPFTTVPNKLLPPNGQPGAFAASGLGEKLWTYSLLNTDFASPPSGQVMAKGLIGAKTNYSNSSYSNVAAYASEAASLGLNFVVFADDYTALAPNGVPNSNYASLVSDCAANSTSTLILYPGYTIQTSVGNRALIFGPAASAPPLVPVSCLTNSNTQLLLNGASYGWLYDYLSGHDNLCYYDFTDAEAVGGMRMQDLRGYAMAAIKYYRGGNVVDDDISNLISSPTTNEYLSTVGSCSSPTPVVFNEVTSATGGAGSMAYEAANNHAMTYAQFYSPLSNLWSQGLAWSGQVNNFDVFASNGPQVQAWPISANWAWNGEATIWAGEEYVCGRCLQPALINVTATAGATLTDVRIYNGTSLYREYNPGTATFNQMLLLDGAVERNLVLIATDSAGNQAVTAYREMTKLDGFEVLYCTDHLSDCKSPASGNAMLFHGPDYNFPVISAPNIANFVPTETWDGGPAAANPLAFWSSDGMISEPLLTSTGGTIGSENGYFFSQTPSLEFSDEGAIAVNSTHDHVYNMTQNQQNQATISPTTAYGPVVPSTLMTFTEQYRQWQLPTTGPVAIGYDCYGNYVGVQPTLFRDLITFKQTQTITNLCLLSNGSRAWPSQQISLVVSQSGTVQTVRLDQLPTSGSGGQVNYPLATGDWFGIFSPGHNTQLFINRGSSVILYAANPNSYNGVWPAPSSGATWLELCANPAGVTEPVTANTTLTYELATYTYPLDSTATGSQTELSNMVAYLNSPTGLTLYGGTAKATSPGLLDLSNTSYAPVEFSVTAPSGRPTMTLPARVTGLNPNWSAGRWLEAGYQRTDYTIAAPYSPMGIDVYGNGYIPVELNITPGSPSSTRIMAGHPVVADSAGTSLIIQVTKVNDSGTPIWNISIDNPTSSAITSTITRQMAIPGLTFTSQSITIQPGQTMSNTVTATTLAVP